MHKFKFNKYWFISGTIVFVLLFAFLVMDIYERTLEDIKKDHQLQQLEMAKTAAQGINYFLQHLVSDMTLFSLNPETNKNDLVSSVSFMNKFMSLNEPSMVKTIFVTDLKGRILNSTGESFPQWIVEHLNKLISTALNNPDSNNYWLSPVIRDESIENNTDLFFIMLAPIISQSLKKNTETIGYVGYFVSFNILVDRFIKPLRLGKSDFAWVLDGTGRLIYHPNHEEMLFQTVYDTTSECRSCHNSFNIQRAMLIAKESSTGEYSIVGDEPPKVIAYFPLKIQNQTWILVISTFLPEVTASLREKFGLFFILGFVILGVTIFFGLLVYYMNSKRIRAEEAKRNLEQIQEYQAQLNQASKLASIGELVDTVSHELNTPAGIIAAHADALILKDNLSDEITNALNIIKKQTRRISDYTRSLLNYSQSMPFNPEPINIEELINESLYLLDHRFRAKSISITKNFETNLVNILADRRQLEQVLINILNNAVDALETDGEIKITLKKLPPDSSSEGNDNGRILISIEDNGAGIPGENIDKIFNPFFSTKSKTEGTGLGLAIAKAIITRHKGNIEVKSIDGNGAIFYIYLTSKSKESEIKF